MTIQCAVTECENEANARPYQITEGVTLSLCQPHMYDVASKTKERARKLAVDLNAVGGIARHTEGWTYVVRLANGNVKIGTTNRPKEKNKMLRLTNLSGKDNENTPVQVLALMQGGESREALAHGLWDHLRVQGAMEQFHPAPDLLQWAEAQGIDPIVSDFEDWTVNKHKRGTVSDYAREMFGDIEQQLADLEKSEDPFSFWE